MKRIAILCGGFSSEFEISLKSAQTILEHFPEEYEVFKVLVSRQHWIAEYRGESIPFNIDSMSCTCAGETIRPDAVLIYTHGEPGENGKIQALLDIKGIPYINSGVLASALSFDKWYCNQFLHPFGIPIAKNRFFMKPSEVDVPAISRDLGLPVFVKPSDSGSSFGISKAKTEEELQLAIDKAFAEGNNVIVEAFLDGTEVTCGVYRRSSGIHALPLTEIVSDNEFFDFDAKYLGKSQEITPARVSDEVRDQVQEHARNIYRLLQLRSIARIDFMIVNGKAHLIEVNTTPGFSSASIVPQMIAADGNNIRNFWKEILGVELGI